MGISLLFIRNFVVGDFIGHLDIAGILRGSVAEMPDARSAYDGECHFITGKEGDQLYYLADDPGEKKNIANDNKGLVMRFKAALKKWQQETSSAR